MAPAPRTAPDAGFSLLELLTVMAMLLTVVLIAIPVYLSASGLAEKRTCLQNQNTLVRQSQLFLAGNEDAHPGDLAGLVTGTHPLVVSGITRDTLRCPSGVSPVDPGNLTIEEGAYQFDSSGVLMACALGAVGPHGRYSDR